MPKAGRKHRATLRKQELESSLVAYTEAQARSIAVKNVANDALFAIDNTKGNKMERIPGVKLFTLPPPPPSARPLTGIERKRLNALAEKVAAKSEQSLTNPTTLTQSNTGIVDLWAEDAPIIVKKEPSVMVPPIGSKRRRPVPGQAAVNEVYKSVGVASRAIEAPSYNPSIESHEAAIREAAEIENAANIWALPPSKRPENAGSLNSLRKAAEKARRPLTIPLSEELTGGLRTMPKVNAATLAVDTLQGYVKTGTVPVRLRKLAKSTGMKKRKPVAFPRKPASHWGIKNEDSK
jgi:Nop53 (60S ribosomal biogenesis)